MIFKIGCVKINEKYPQGQVWKAVQLFFKTARPVLQYQQHISAYNVVVQYAQVRHTCEPHGRIDRRLIISWKHMSVAFCAMNDTHNGKVESTVYLFSFKRSSNCSICICHFLARRPTPISPIVEVCLLTKLSKWYIFSSSYLADVAEIKERCFSNPHFRC